MNSSIIQKSQLEGAQRMDAEYYQPEFIEMANLINLNRNVELRDLTVWIKKGIFDLSPDNYKDDGIPFIRTLGINDPLIDFSGIVFLDRGTHQKNKTTALFPGDLVFTKIGANIGKGAILPPTFNEYNFSQNVAGAKVRQDIIKSGYLLAYLLSKFGGGQIDRAQMISGQSKLELEDLRKLKIVITRDEVQQEINSLVIQAQDLKSQSLRRYQQAEDLLLKELGLKDFLIPDDLSWVINFLETQGVNRIDAEYFQPKYDFLISHIKKISKLLKNIASRDDEVIKIKPEVEYKYIEISNINVANSEITTNLLVGKYLPVNAKMKISGGELLISKVRPTRGAIAIVPGSWSENYVASGAFSVFNIDSPMKECLQVILRSLIGKLQLEKPTTGTSYPIVTDEDIENVLIPILPKEIQQKIAELVKKSHEARKKSKELLEEAKRKIEEMIEKGGESNGSN
ncbi:MAG: hypothetical protein A2784_02315 [Candidatus Chisholmbacteria bacterium RIFCSPHIGHO2_01_FULL_48_12]|uniref:Type I restriction modification DNA specificity domain-containing protein n=1 Tax=Candidatus Chisholmbacteria bacterium RIFCSPHIGHO2_01_FULL_48_12 TaxID=1797589 RepID=A0A1G1VJD5_9BACT|nr:MAG: hypothetical protein A2784_02315 [Candidatus Chisholmbacteria bacterium RIFCSPHIGHO2_01_FULL_48_12]